MLSSYKSFINSTLTDTAGQYANGMHATRTDVHNQNKPRLLSKLLPHWKSELALSWSLHLGVSQLCRQYFHYARQSCVQRALSTLPKAQPHVTSPTSYTRRCAVLTVQEGSVPTQTALLIWEDDHTAAIYVWLWLNCICRQAHAELGADQKTQPNKLCLCPCLPQS